MVIIMLFAAVTRTVTASGTDTIRSAKTSIICCHLRAEVPHGQAHAMFNNRVRSLTMFIERDGYGIWTTVVVIQLIRVLKKQYYTVFQEKSERI